MGELVYNQTGVKMIPPTGILFSKFDVFVCFKSMLRILEFSSGSWSKLWTFLKNILLFLRKEDYSYYFSSFFVAFLILIHNTHLDEPYRNKEIFNNTALCSTFQIENKKYVLCSFGQYLPLISGSLDSHIFADLDPNLWSQNGADSANLDLDPKHCFKMLLNRGVLS